MRILISGGLGFIGSHLAEFFVNERNHDIIIIDDSSSGRVKNISSFANKVKLIECDVNSLNLDELVRFEPDYIFHLAALADIVPSIQKPRGYLEANVSGTERMLELARRLPNLKKFIYAASSSCYGKKPQPFVTEMGVVDPQYPYALTKWMGEELLLHWGRVYKVPVISLRLFNVYGPRSRTNGAYGAMFGTFLKQKLSNEPLTIVGDGKQSRDFVYVTDVVQAMVQAAQSKVRNEVFNVGTGVATSINTIAKLIGGDVVYIPKRPGEPEITQASICKITNAIGWQPMVSIEKGVKYLIETLEYWAEAPLWTPELIERETKDWFKYLGK